jgi:hypothetical protein
MKRLNFIEQIETVSPIRHIWIFFFKPIPAKLARQLDAFMLTQAMESQPEMGFDDKRIDTLFLTRPISWRGTLNQYADRLHRIHFYRFSSMLPRRPLKPFV